MTKIFKKNDILNLLALLPYTAVLRLDTLITPDVYIVQSYDGVLINALYKNLLYSPIVQSIVAILLLYIQAIFINNISNRNRIYGSQCGYAGMLYVLLASLVPSLRMLSPVLIGMTFFLVGVYYTYKVYKRNNANTEIFNAALSLGLASLIYPPYLLVGLALLVEMFVLRSFSFKEQLQFLIGLFCTFWIVGAFLYFFDMITFELFNQFSLGLSYEFLIPQNNKEIVGYGILLVSLIVGLLSYYSYQKKKNVESRKKIDFLYLVCFLLLLTLFCYRYIVSDHLLILIFPFSIMMAMTLYSIKNWARIELVHIVLLLAVFFVQYGDRLQFIF